MFACVPLVWFPPLVGKGVGPLVYVRLWSAAPRHVQVTVPPACITTLAGLKKLSCTSTAADVGGAAAWAVNVSTGRPAVDPVAVTLCVADEAPSVCVVIATPFALVVLCAGATEPSCAVAGAQVTTTPGTGQLF